MSEVLPDIPRIYTALSEWLACLVYISLLKKRPPGWKLFMFSASFLVVQSLFFVLTRDLPIAFWIPVMIAAVGIMFGFILTSCSIKILDGFYFSVRAFVAAEFVASLEWQVHFFLFGQREERHFPELLLLVGIYGSLFALIWLLEKRHVPAGFGLNIQQRELWPMVLIGAAVFAMSNLSFVTSRTPFSGVYAQDILNIRTLVDLGGFSILYAYHIQMSQLRISRELAAMQNILHNQFQQYQHSKETIELINYKYHDLKNQITALQAETDTNRKNAYLMEMKNEIKAYEAQNKTGNPVLDIVLTSKSLQCLKKGITLNSIVDGTLLGGMELIDICTIFGNALDNAIEYEEQIEDGEKRLIHVSAFAQKSFLMIRFENYHEGDLELSEGLPITTKKDKNHHGYGLKSIRYTAQKYGGAVQVSQKENWFELNILIPLSELERKS
ncbi:hypothetical protein D3C74_125540 [compost metagenome]